jgi:L-lactate dehydrogenase (cytochrome)
MLPKIVNATDGKCEVWMDGGIRSGQDILKAKALGATGTMIGRSYIYGLGAMGEAGVTTALEVLQKELETTMALCGYRDINSVDRDILYIPDNFEGHWA